MESKDKIAISDIVRDLELNVVYQPEGKEFFVKSQDVNRTGLALAGYFEYFAFDRIQIITIIIIYFKKEIRWKL